MSSEDEDNAAYEEILSLEVAESVPLIFGKELKIERNNQEEILQINVSPIRELDTSKLVQLLEIVSMNLDIHYTKTQGPNWKESKLEEMQEPGLIYITITNTNQEIIGFLSFMLTVEQDLKLLYLYEIHCIRKYQKLRIGSKLLDKLHKFSEYLNVDIGHSTRYDIFKNIGVALTVFSDNVNALNWYKSEGYKVAPFSPQDKVLRNGKVIKPDYYTMIWFNESTKKMA